MSFLSGKFTMEQMEKKIGGCISCEQTCAADLKVREYYNYPPKKSREKSISVVRLGKKSSDKTDHPSPPLTSVVGP